MSAAELQIAVRVECSAAHVRDALWRDRTLVKTWLMRGTLHLVPAVDLPLYAAAMRTKWMTPRASWLRFFQMTDQQLADFADLIGSVLTATPMSREELISAVSKGRSERVREWLRSGWGGLLKPAARRGLLCFGPSRGTSVTFVRPALWLGSWRDIDPDAALVEMARRYLRAYGPAIRSDFARWWGPSFAGAARAAWGGLADELVPVSVEGARAHMLVSELGALKKVKIGQSVQLLPAFDPYLMGHASRDHLFDRAHARKVSRVAGWISSVVLADGRVVGTWTHRKDNGTLRVAIERFGTLSSRVRAGIGLRADALAEATGASCAEVTIR
jgi:hypothetical protein